ncbi:MAG: nucleotidyltransferase domain-containing protein [Candidatus Omnitrophota bacterium]
MASLNAAEIKWLNQYRERLYAQYPGLVEDIILFGSKARGDAREDSDLDLMVVIREGDRSVKKILHF